MPSPLTSAAASVVGSHEAEPPPAANASAIAASAGVIWSSRLRLPNCCVVIWMHELVIVHAAAAGDHTGSSRVILPP